MHNSYSWVSPKARPGVVFSVVSAEPGCWLYKPYHASAYSTVNSKILQLFRYGIIIS